MEFTKKLLELINEFNKVSNCISILLEVNNQKSKFIFKKPV